MRKHGLILLEEFRDYILQLWKILSENFLPFFFLITEIKIKHYQFAQLLGSISSVSQQQCYWHFRWAILCFRLLSLVPDHQMPMVHLFPSPTVTMTTKNAPILFQIFCGNMVPLPLRITDEFSRYPPFIKWLPHNELWH